MATGRRRTLGVMGARVHRFNYLNLHDEEFEELTFLLAHLEEPGLVRPEDPDLGLDGVVRASGNGPVSRGFQAKHFTGSPSWPQCRRSLDNAVANYEVEHVTFTFPRDLTGKQIRKFDAELADRHPGVGVDFWGASQLTARLLGSNDGERIARHIFGVEEFERISRLIRAGQELDTGGHAIQVLGAANNLFTDDPYFGYSLGTRPLSVTDVPPTAGAVMGVEVSDEHGVHHINAHAKPAALAADRCLKGRSRSQARTRIGAFRNSFAWAANSNCKKCA